MVTVPRECEHEQKRDSSGRAGKPARLKRDWEYHEGRRRASRDVSRTATLADQAGRLGLPASLVACHHLSGQQHADPVFCSHHVAEHTGAGA